MDSREEGRELVYYSGSQAQKAFQEGRSDWLPNAANNREATFGFGIMKEEGLETANTQAVFNSNFVVKERRGTAGRRAWVEQRF